MNIKELIDHIKYNILHLRPQLDSYDDYITYLEDLWSFEEDEDMSGKSARGLGTLAFKQMVELNSTLRMLQNKVKRKLPDYLKDNLEEISIGGDVSHISLQFHFKNYNLMNRKIVNEIRSDFASCIQTDSLPSYKIKYGDTDFILIFYLDDYS